MDLSYLLFLEPLPAEVDDAILGAASKKKPAPAEREDEPSEKEPSEKEPSEKEPSEKEEPSEEADKPHEKRPPAAPPEPATPDANPIDPRVFTT